MKQFTLIIVVSIITALSALGQDVIIKKKGEKIECKVVEITKRVVKYKLYTQPNGPIRSISKRKVHMVKYEDGLHETITPKREKKYYKPIFMASVGYGNSYAGTGIRLGYRTGGTVAFGVHVGVGYSSDIDKTSGAFGLKLFPYKSLYLNAQYGMIGSYKYFEDGKAVKDELEGISVMAGIDKIWGDKIGYGFNIAVGPAFSVSNSKVLTAFDIGFILRF
jgi:hypothetical protein